MTVNRTDLIGTTAAPRSTTHRQRRGFIPIREEGTGWLLFLYDPKRRIIEVQRRGRKQIIDLAEFDEEPGQ